MDLLEFYMDNVTPDEYYYKFYDLIHDVNYTYNIFIGKEETFDYEFIVFDVEEAIEKLKSLCMPENENHNNEEKCWFYLIMYYLYKQGYILEQFPRVLARPPMDTYQFVNRDIRNKLLIDGRDCNGTVRWEERRKFVSGFKFKQEDSYVEINYDIDNKFKEISTRQASFEMMSVDERIKEIANLIENMLKKDEKFIELDYSSITFDYISDELIRKYRKQIQCFRHSTGESLKERNQYTTEQKNFFIDLGLTIIKVIYDLTQNNVEGNS